LSEIHTKETELPDFAHAMNSTLDNLENIVETLLARLEKIEKLDTLHKPSRSDTSPNGNGPNTEEIKPLTNATTSVKMSHQEPSKKHGDTEMTINSGTKLQQSRPSEVQESAPTTVRESDMSKRSILAGAFNKTIKKAPSRSDYYILAVALAILCIIIAKLSFMLFS
jgi:hypothetical protein